MKVHFDADHTSKPRLVYLDDHAPMPKPAPMPDTTTTTQRRGVRNWEVAVVYAVIHTGLMTTVIMLATGDNALGLLSLAWHGACLFVGLSYGLVFRRL